MMTLPERVRDAATAHAMLQPGDAAVVAVSGGPDSLALLYSLHSLSADLDLRLHVAHLNHMLRGEAASADARFVEEVARGLGLPATIEARDVRALRTSRGLGVEEAARAARYEFLAEVVAAVGASAVAVGHTADDQVETVILHWLRGSGLAGLRGMRPVSVLRVRLGETTVPLRVIRPLLEVTRAEVEAYCRELGLQPRADETNAEAAFRRNQIRHELLPALERYNPRFREAALRLARLADEDEDYLAGEARRAWDEVARPVEGGFAIGLDAWRRLAPAIQGRLLREAYARIAGDPSGLAAIHLEAARRALAEGRAGSVLDWPRGVRLAIGYGELRVTRGATLRRLPEGERPLALPGITWLAGADVGIAARLADEPCPWDRADPRHADLDFSATGPELVVRRRRPGDRLVPLGLGAPKKLQDVLVDARVPRDERDAVPVVTNGRDVVWAGGVRLDDRFKVTPATRSVLCLRLVGALP